MMLMSRFQKELEDSAGMKLDLKINNNRSTMLSVRWQPEGAKVSLHSMFLEAPQNVMQSLACYLRREDKKLAPHIKSFIEKNVQKLDYTHLLDRKKLCTQGNVYNLRKVYEELNDQYFNRELDLYISWFGKSNHRYRSRVTFGLYYDPMKLIKIHRLLDNPSFPDYVVSFVVYHEMVHCICPSYVDERGINRIHSKEFKQREAEFVHYDLAQKWIREHHKFLFH